MHVNFFKALLEDTPKPLTCPNIRPFPYPHISMVLGYLPVVITKNNWNLKWLDLAKLPKKTWKYCHNSENKHVEKMEIRITQFVVITKSKTTDDTSKYSQKIDRMLSPFWISPMKHKKRLTWGWDPRGICWRYRRRAAARVLFRHYLCQGELSLKEVHPIPRAIFYVAFI